MESLDNIQDDSKKLLGQFFTITNPFNIDIFYKSLDGVTIKLMQGAKYTFKVTIVIDKKDGSDTEFTYSSTTTLPGVITSPVIAYERFYGELDDFTPIEGKNVEISTKRVSYAAKFKGRNFGRCGF